MKKVLMVLTSHGELGDTGEKTGWYLSEVSHPYFEFQQAGFSVDFMSPLGGKPPMDPGSRDLTDPDNRKFLSDPDIVARLANTLTPEDVRPQDYYGIFFAGGHGAMWDFPDNPGLIWLAEQIYGTGGVVAAVCHGPAALIHVRLPDERYLVQGRAVTAFTNSEERAVGKDRIVPFLLETRLRQQGAKFEAAPDWSEHVVVDDRLATGQNPASARKLGALVVRMMGAKLPETSDIAQAPP